ncbi:hypothetical protein [Pseudidiomarina donghaiensis]|uniref:hypothetical protein n=1 Tax=Pseudidiomarina donghaiensis TaxID=519452 RepID=UPI003A97AFB7
MSRFSEISKILKEEPEEWLAYLYGQQLDNLSHLKEAKPRFAGVFFRSLAFFYHITRSLFLSFFAKKKNQKKVDFYFYAGSANQANSLTGTAKSLEGRKAIVRTDSNNTGRLNGANKVITFNQLDVRISDLVISTLLFFTHAPSLYTRLKNSDVDKVNKYFNTFCLSYFYLAVFHRLLNMYQPRYTIVANDHNVDCRCLMAVAKHLRVKTVYMQHASVSNVFPALTVDYAFLDGESALNTYRNCKNNLPNTCNDRNAPKVFLSGQKKLLSVSEQTASKKVGLAINTLDDLKDVIALVDNLVGENKAISLRWHPGQKANDVTRLKELYQNNSSVFLSDPKHQSINGYLAELEYLIAGNSSIHLEAAITGVVPIYYELQPPTIEDYYGYVKNGIAIQATSYQNLSKFLSSGKKPTLSTKSIQYYSATYGTEWHGKVGELVADILMRLSKGELWENFFGAQK